MKKTVTIKNVAQEMGLSVSAISKALNGYPDISESTRNLVIKKAEEMGYSPNLVARNLVKSTSNIVGVIVRDLSSVYGECIPMINAVARENNLMVLVCDSCKDKQLELEYIKSMLDLHVKGLIIAPVSSDIGKIKSLVNFRCPIVFFGDQVTDFEENFVCNDFKKGAYMAMEYLFSLGHKNIALFCDSKNSVSTCEKINVYSEQMSARGYFQMIFSDENSDRSLSEKGYDFAVKLIESQDICSAIYCVKDIMASGVVKAFQDRGKKIPRDISILGFDGSAVTGLPTIELTTVSTDKEKTAHEVIRILMEQAESDNKEPQHSFIEPNLIIRKSCGKLKK